MNRPSVRSSRFSPGTVRRLAQAALAIGAAGGCLLAAPMKASAAVATFKYNFELEPNGPLTNLDPLAAGDYWALVTLADVNDLQPDGQFTMKIETSFDEIATPDAAITQLVFNLNGYTDSNFPVLFEVLSCTPDKLTSTICDSFSPPIDPLKPFSMVTGPLNPTNPNSPYNNGVGVDGAGTLGNGFDVLLTLPEANPKLSNDQSPITLLINGPSGDFSVASFLGSCSNDGGYDIPDGCEQDSFQTAAKVQSLPGQPGSTVIGGISNGENPPGPTEGVPGPLPLLGAATAFSFSRKLRKRIASQQWRKSYTL